MSCKWNHDDAGEHHCKVVTIPTAMKKKHDTRASSGYWNGSEGRWGECEPRRRPQDHGLHLASNTKELAKVLAKVKTGMRRMAKAAKMEERTLGRKAVTRKEEKDKRKTKEKLLCCTKLQCVLSCRMSNTF